MPVSLDKDQEQRGLTLCTGSGEQCGEVFSGVTWKRLHIILGLFLETKKTNKPTTVNVSQNNILFSISPITASQPQFIDILVTNLCKICT